MALSPQIEALGIEQIKAVTPRGDDKRGPISDYWAQHGTTGPHQILAETTVAGTEAADGGMVTHIAQPDFSTPDQSGNWGGYNIPSIVIGGRGPIRLKYAKTLSAPGFGPAHEAGPAKAHDYPAEAIPSIMDGLGNIVHDYGAEVLTTALKE